MSDDAVLKLDGVVRTYRQAGESLEVLRGVNLDLRGGELIALVGPSGAGKSSLLHLAGLLERPDGGEIFIEGKPCGKMSDDKRTVLRRRDIGFVYHLMPEFSALENVMIPQMINRTGKWAARRHARALLELVGLQDRMKHRPARLSGGEQQRVAIARAVANRPLLLLADEPTGNLDHKTADDVFDMMKGFVHEAGIAALVATHNLALAARMDRVVRLEDGLLLDGAG